VKTATSEKKRAANRANARASTGPRTPAGKRTVARNARRHGLNLPVMDDPALAPQVEALARDICGLGVNAQRQVSAHHPAPHPALYAAVPPALHEKLHLARRIAEAEIDLVRVRRARHDLVARALADRNYRSSARLGARIALLRRTGEMLHLGVPVAPELRDAILSRPQGPRKFVLILADLAGELAAMDRYERRARSRRKFAIRAFDAARSSPSPCLRGEITVSSLPVQSNSAVADFDMHSAEIGQARFRMESRVGPPLQQALRRGEDPTPPSIRSRIYPTSALNMSKSATADFDWTGREEKALKTLRDKQLPHDLQALGPQRLDQVPVIEATAPGRPAFWQNKATAADDDAGIAQRPTAPAGKRPSPLPPGPYPDFAKRPYRALAKPPPDEMPFRQAADRLRDLLGLPATGPPGGPSGGRF
jgi:hypothetical protein